MGRVWKSVYPRRRLADWKICSELVELHQDQQPVNIARTSATEGQGPWAYHCQQPHKVLNQYLSDGSSCLMAA